ncbi:MAG: MlaD family protein [Pseudohongiella nitratireducens]|nr:MlaD family protein [Pseudohongiella nitratireducens]
METRAHHILIGLFTLSGIAALLAVALWLSQSDGDQAFDNYDVVFREAVSGLSVGNPVQYNGIRVGEVSTLSLDPKDPRQVWARIRVNGRTPIKTDTAARLTLLNITGAAGISLSQGMPESPLLLETTSGVPVIVAEPSSLEQLRGDADELLMELSSLVGRGNNILSDNNVTHISDVLSNLSAMTQSLAAEQESLHEALDSMATAGRDISKLVTQIQTETAGHTSAILEETRASVASANQLIERLDQLVNENAEAVNAGMQSLTGLDPAIRDLRDTMARFNRMARDFENSPGNFLLGGESIQEYTP